MRNLPQNLEHMKGNSRRKEKSQSRLMKGSLPLLRGMFIAPGKAGLPKDLPRFSGVNEHEETFNHQPVPAVELTVAGNQPLCCTTDDGLFLSVAEARYMRMQE